MADRKLMEEYENSIMSLAVSEMLEEFGKSLKKNIRIWMTFLTTRKQEKNFIKLLTGNTEKAGSVHLEKGCNIRKIRCNGMCCYNCILFNICSLC